MDHYLNLSEAARLLRVTTKTLRGRVKAGQIEAALMGGRYYIREAAIVEYFTSHIVVGYVSAPALGSSNEAAGMIPQGRNLDKKQS